VSKSTRLPNVFWRLWSATSISNLGDGIASVAYPWLASATTRSPFLIALITLAQRLPWLIFTLPAGVITDRYDRKKILVLMDFCRGALTLIVVLGVVVNKSHLPALKDVVSLKETHYGLYWILVLTALIFGMMDVLHNNTAQTILPSLVNSEHLEKANGRMGTAEALFGSFIGPPLGSLLLGFALAAPFIFDATSFFICAGLMGAISGSFRSDKPISERQNFKVEMKEGVSWLWRNKFLRDLAIILGCFNLYSSIPNAIQIFYAQEVLHTSVFIFAILGTAGAVGGILGGMLGPKVAKRLGDGKSLALALAGIPIATLILGLTSSWQIAWIVFAAETFCSMLWNLITVSLRQSIIPGDLMGRVNSVYRMFAWGTIPIATLLGGAIVSIGEHFYSREIALRSTFIIAFVLGSVLFAFAAPRLTSAKIAAAREAGAK